MAKFGILHQGIFVLIVGLSTWVVSLTFAGDFGSMRSVQLIGPVTSSQRQLPHQPQGIRGLILSLNGNQMPMIQPNESRSGSQPVSTKVWIFSGNIISSGSPRWSIEQARQNPNLIGWVVSNSAGEFEVGLPPGEYTLLTEYDSDLYLNEFFADGSYASIQVVQNQVTQVQLINTENAVF
jgi:hypothetical protein